MFFGPERPRWHLHLPIDRYVVNDQKNPTNNGAHANDLMAGTVAGRVSVMCW